ncbi:unnamed protein product [Amoebophrya sp. A120]|nr:unnamed protein product [Amoebophrya sp. A120]|eukprot:GSA120T00013288001.1
MFNRDDLRLHRIKHPYCIALCSLPHAVHYCFVGIYFLLIDEKIILGWVIRHHSDQCRSCAREKRSRRDTILVLFTSCYPCDRSICTRSQPCRLLGIVPKHL